MAHPQNSFRGLWAKQRIDFPAAEGQLTYNSTGVIFSGGLYINGASGHLITANSTGAVLTGAMYLGANAATRKISATSTTSTFANGITVAGADGLKLTAGGATVGASGAGFDVTFYGDTAGADFLWDQNGDTNGSLTLGNAAGAKGCDFIAYGATAANYLHWDQSGDDLLLVGTSTQLAVAGTTAASSTTTGSLRTAGGLGVAGAAYIGGKAYITGGATMASPDAAGGIGITTANLYGADVYAELLAAGAALALGEVAGALRGRLRVSLAQTNATLFGASGHLRVVGVNTGSGVHTGLYGYYEQSGTTALASGSENGGLQIDIEGGSALTCSSGGYLFGIGITSNVNGSATMTGDWDAIKVKTTSTCEQFKVGLQIEDAAALVGIGIGSCTTGISISGATSGIEVTSTGTGVSVTTSTLNASTGRVGKFSGAVAAPNQGDGYGAFEIDITSSGTVAGTTAASSTWLNFAAASAPGSNLICVQNNGIWLDTGITATSAKMIMGMRMQYVAQDGGNPGSLFCFSTNIYSNVLTAVFDINAIEDFAPAGTKSGDSVAIPFIKAANSGTVYYVNAYSS